MSISMEYRGPALAAATGDWRATFFEGQAFIANPGATDWAVSVVAGVAYDGTETLVTLRSAVLTEAFTAAQVGRNPAGDVQAHAARHKAGGLDPLSHADLAGVAAGTMTHAQIDAYLAGLSEVVSDIDADLAAEVTARQIFQAAVEQTLLDQEAALDDAVAALETAVNLRALAARAISSTFPIQGGGSLAADRTLTLALAVVSELLGYGVTLSGKVVTDQILKAAAKLLISTNTTIYVATTGSDATGTGLAGAPFASIAKALSSIAGMLIASGVTVTIQCADGTYAIGSTIVIDHPDADKIRILGNVSAETAIAIASVDTVNKKIVVSGNYTATAGLASGDKIIVTGSSTAALNRSYTINGAPVYTGGNTEITVSESIASATVGGAVLTAKPCNKCILTTSGNIVTFKIAKSLGQLAGFRLNGPGIALGQAIQPCVGAQTLVYKMIVTGYGFGLSSLTSAYTDLQDTLFYGCGYGIFTQGFAKVSCNAGTKVVCDACNYGVAAVAGGKNMVPPSVMTMANAAVADYSPAATGTTNQTISGAMNIPTATL